MNVIDIVKLNIVSNTKTNNIFIDMMISSVVLFIVSYISNNYLIIIANMKEYFYNGTTMKYNIELIGSKITTHSSIMTTVYTLYTDEVKAMLYFLNNEIGHNQNIIRVKQSYNSISSDINYMINQRNRFLIHKELDIYGKIITYDLKNDKKEDPLTEMIIIYISSNTTNLIGLKKWINTVTDTYLQSRRNSRHTKLFVYTLLRTETWRERQFISNSSFDNIFFNGKKEVLFKIDYFLNSKEWYVKRGVPYTLGIGLHGPPGTGKTSFIKSLAVYTKRHIVILSLKNITSMEQLESRFIESTYSCHNSQNSIGFDKKIIVIEDIDCLGDLVKNRQRVADKIVPFGQNEMKTMLQEVLNEDKDKIPFTITLDDLLNLWDGVCETPGRIIVITSNCYHELDPALVRPGRIDITIELKNVSHEILCEMFFNYYNIAMDPVQLLEIKENYFSPAEVVNIFHGLPNDPVLFIKELIKRSNMKRENEWIVK